MLTLGLPPGRGALLPGLLLITLAVALSAVAPGTASAEGKPTRSKFYDFSGQTIDADRKAPGLTVIFGEAYGRSVCQEDDVKAFRRCIGEVEDVFPSRPPKDRPVDFLIVPIGGTAAGVTFTSEVSGLAATLRALGTDARFIPVPSPEVLDEDGDLQLVTHIDSSEEGFYDRLRLVVSGSARRNGVATGLQEVSRLFSPEDPKSFARNPREGLPISPLLRPASFIALVIIASDGPAKGDAARLATILNETVEHSGWGAYVLCSSSACDSLRPLAVHPGDLILPAEKAGNGRLLKQVAEASAWRLDRYLLSSPPTISGYLEVQAGDKRLDPSVWSYDPFERRIRLASDALDEAGSTPVEAWYFPFDPLHVLAQMCPEATRPRTGTSAIPAGGVKPCDGWAADEVVAPRPATAIDVRWVPALPRNASTADMAHALDAFRQPFQKSEVDLFMSIKGTPTPWRGQAFHVAITTRRGVSVEGADAVFAWNGSYDPATFEALAWRAINRSIRVPITGIPIFNTFHVYLNGREIQPSSGDGAGFVLKAGGMHLDVAAPIHPQSHIFLSYRLDSKSRKRPHGK